MYMPGLVRPTRPLLYCYIEASIGMSLKYSILVIGNLYASLNFIQSITKDRLFIVYPVSITLVANIILN